MILICSCEAPLQSIDSKGELTPCGFESSSETEGIKTKSRLCTIMLLGLKAALNQKGLRLSLYAGFESSPESKGLKYKQIA